MIEFFFCNYYLMMLKEMNIYIFRKGALIGKIRNVFGLSIANCPISSSYHNSTESRLDVLLISMLHACPIFVGVFPE